MVGVPFTRAVLSYADNPYTQASRLSFRKMSSEKLSTACTYRKEWSEWNIFFPWDAWKSFTRDWTPMKIRRVWPKVNLLGSRSSTNRRGCVTRESGPSAGTWPAEAIPRRPHVYNANVAAQKGFLPTHIASSPVSTINATRKLNNDRQLSLGLSLKSRR